MNDEQNLDKLAAALTKAQATMSGAKKGSVNPFFKSKYADLASVFEAIKDPFAENNLCVTQVMDVLGTGRMVIKTLLMHSSGQHLTSSMMLPDIADSQKLGSSITYFRRYSLMSIAGLPAEDDDGNKASQYFDKSKVSKVKPANVKPAKKPPMISDKQASLLKRRLDCFPDYKLKVKEYLDNINSCVEELDPLAAERIEAKLEKLEGDASEALLQAKG
jgi:hypothetical protein